MYALPITLRYKNQRKFYTNAGALTSLAIYLVLLSMLMNYLTVVFDKEVSSITSQETNFLASLEKINTTESNDILFFMAFRFTDLTGHTVESDPTGLTIKFRHV